MSTKNSSDTTGNRTRDFPTCCAVSTNCATVILPEKITTSKTFNGRSAKTHLLVSLSVPSCQNSPSRPMESQTWKPTVCYEGVKRVGDAVVIPFFHSALNVCGCVLPTGSSKSSITKTHSVSEGWIPAPTNLNIAVNLANVKLVR